MAIEAGSHRKTIVDHIVPLEFGSLVSSQRSLLEVRIILTAVSLTLLCVVGGAQQKANPPMSVPSAGTESSGKEIRLLFAGDILLSRQVAAEVARKNVSPLKNVESLIHSADWATGNLEGAVGNASDCLEPPSESSPCFAIDPSLIHLLHEAGFTALGNENNHAGDLGAAGRAATRSSLRAQSLLPLTFDASPAFLRFGATTVAIISITEILDHQGDPAEMRSVGLDQKIRLARALANLVVVSIHWGDELMDWPSEKQRHDAAWLIARGADLIIGAHPHVVQKPECVRGKPVFYSVGNFLFDQKYPATKEGLIADCKIVQNILRCSGIRTQTQVATSFPDVAAADESVDSALAACPVSLHPALAISGYILRPEPSSPQNVKGEMWIEGFRTDAPRDSKPSWRTRPAQVLSMETAKLKGPDGPEFLLSVEKHSSPIDSENDPRPYVYEVGPSGFIARWRGSALAWPLIDARLLPANDGVLCALHRSDSFLVLSAKSNSTRVAAYRWNGFGFDGISDATILSQCQSLIRW
jgi:hypothetical protein